MAFGLTILFSLFGFFSPPRAASDVAEISRLQSEKNGGRAAVQEGTLPEARRRFESVRRLDPRGRLGWADGPVVAMRRKDMPRARPLLVEARRIAPGDSRILALEAALAELTGDFPAAVE